MNIGIFTGGFKPFHSGHFAKLVLAHRENDGVILIIGGAGRKKGAGVEITDKEVEKMWEGHDGWTGITYRLKQTLPKLVYARFPVLPGPPKKSTGEMGKSTPIGDVFQIVRGVIDEVNHGMTKSEILSQFNIPNVDPTHVGLTIYGGRKDLKIYTRLEGTSILREFRMDSGQEPNQTMDRLLKAQCAIESGDLTAYRDELPYLSPQLKADMIRKITVRGSQIRTMERENVRDFLPAIYTPEDKDRVLDLMLKRNTQEAMLRELVGGILVG